MVENTNNNNSNVKCCFHNTNHFCKTISRHLKNWSLHRSEFPTLGRTCIHPWTCMESLSHLWLLNPTQACLQNKLMIGPMQTRYSRRTLLSALSNNLFDVYCSYKEAKYIWDSLILKYIVEDVIRQRFMIENYHRWEMIKDKDIKIQINEYHKLLEDIIVESIALPDEIVFKLLIEKLLQSWIDYKQQLKHKHKQISLSDLITHIIIEDTNRSVLL